MKDTKQFDSIIKKFFNNDSLISTWIDESGENIVNATASAFLLLDKHPYKKQLFNEKVDGSTYMDYTVYEIEGVLFLLQSGNIPDSLWFKESDIDRIIELASEYDHIKLSDGRKLYEKYDSCRGFAGEPCTMYWLEIDGQGVTIEQVRELLTEKDLNRLETTMREVSEENDNNVMSYII